MGRSPYQSEKRRKELARLKKQEEKRQRRFNKKHEGDTAETPAEGAPTSPEPGAVSTEDVQAPQGSAENAPSDGQPAPSKEDQDPGQPS